MLLKASDDTTILAKRANYLNTETKKPIQEIADFKLEYGEFLYLEDLDILIMGDGRWPDEIPLEDRTKLIGSSVAELIANYEYFAKVKDPKFYGQAQYQWIGADGKANDIPLDTKDLTIANTKFVNALITTEIKTITDSIGNITITNDDVGKTLTKYSTDANGKVTLNFDPIKIPYSNITGNKPMAADSNPIMDGKASKGTDTWHYALDDHVHPTDSSRAPINGPQLKKTNGNTGNNPTTPDIVETESNQQIVNKKFVDGKISEVGAEISRVDTKTQNTSDTIYVVGVQVPAEGTKIATSTTNKLEYCGTNDAAIAPAANKAGIRINCKTGALFGAAWNDFAEFRECIGEPGTVVCETGKGNLVISQTRLQPGAAVISDTYGMVIGSEIDGYNPIAVAGRVLAKPGDPLICYLPGMPVCAGPEGKIYAMTREESINYPEAILGYISEIPEYTEWNGIDVNNRIWIKIK